MDINLQEAPSDELNAWCGEYRSTDPHPYTKEWEYAGELLEELQNSPLTSKVHLLEFHELSPESVTRAYIQAALRGLLGTEYGPDVETCRECGGEVHGYWSSWDPPEHPRGECLNCGAFYCTCGLCETDTEAQGWPW